jgi:hypothetical protein
MAIMKLLSITMKQSVCITRYCYVDDDVEYVHSTYNCLYTCKVFPIENHYEFVCHDINDCSDMNDYLSTFRKRYSS